MRLGIAFTAVSLLTYASDGDAQNVNSITELQFKLSPKFGESLLKTEGNQPVDESEVQLALRFVRPITTGIALEAIPVVAYSPQVYDDNDPSSQLRIGFELRRKVSVGRDGRPLRYTSVGEIGVEPFLRYSPSVGFKDAFGRHAFFDNGFATGIRLQNAVWFHCRRQWIMQVGLGCDVDRKVGVRVTPQIQYTLSDQTGRRRLTPQIDARIVVPIRDIDVRLTATFENRRFTELRLPTGVGLQRDGRVTSSISFDFAPAIPKIRRWLFGDENGLKIVNNFTLEIGASYVRNRSNDPAKNFDRIFFAPAFTYSRQLD